jgi:molybdenum cofactor biosynthesis enzyme MoaA
MSNTRCALPWQSLSIDNQGRSRICCNSNAHYAMGTQGTKVTKCGTVQEAMTTDYHDSVRSSMLRGDRHPSCVKCWDIEDHGGRSFRQIWNDILVETDHIVPRYLDITLGNKCNLTCRMCNEWNSHLWQIDNVRMARRTDPELSDLFWFEDPSARQLIMDAVSTATHINFLGGEPLIVSEQLDLLARCVEQGRAKDIELSYNTNMTVLRPRQLDLWQNFKRVNLSVSLDGVRAQNDYIRQHSQWSDIEHNLATVYHSCANVRMTVHATFGVLNALTLSELVRWSDDQPWFGRRLPWLNTVTYPSYQDTRHLPDHAKAVVEQRLRDCVKDRQSDGSYHSYSNAINHMRQSCSSDCWSAFWADVDQLDQHKHTDIAASLPELASYRP